MIAQFNFRINNELKEQVARKSRESGVPIATVCRLAVEKYLDEDWMPESTPGIKNMQGSATLPLELMNRVMAKRKTQLARLDLARVCRGGLQLWVDGAWEITIDETIIVR